MIQIKLQLFIIKMKFVILRVRFIFSIKKRLSFVSHFSSFS